MNLYQNLKECSFALKFDNLLTVWADVYLNGVRQGVQIEIPVDVYPDWLPASQHEALRDMWDIQQGNAKTFTK
jgi:hypothetical protein